MTTLKLPARPRSETGRQIKPLREKGLVPAILYGYGVKNQPLSILARDLARVYQQAGKSTLVETVIDHQAVKSLIHDLQFHPLTGEPIHVDLLAVKLTEKITTDIPIKITGESPAVKERQGTLIVNRDHLKAEALPQDLIHEIEVDVSRLKNFDQAIHVKDLVVPTTIKVLDDPDEVVVLVQPPRSEEELAALEEKPTEEVETVEVEEKGKAAEGGEAAKEAKADVGEQNDKPQNPNGK